MALKNRPVLKSRCPMPEAYLQGFLADARSAPQRAGRGLCRADRRPRSRMATRRAKSISRRVSVSPSRRVAKMLTRLCADGGLFPENPSVGVPDPQRPQGRGRKSHSATSNSWKPSCARSASVPRPRQLMRRASSTMSAPKHSRHFAAPWPRSADAAASAHVRHPRLAAPRQLRHRHDRVRGRGPAAGHRRRPRGHHPPARAFSSPATRSASPSAARSWRWSPPAFRASPRSSPSSRSSSPATSSRALAPSFAVADARPRGGGGGARLLLRPRDPARPPRSSRRERRGMALAIVVGGINVANIVGVPLGTAVGTAFGWRAAFVMVGLIALAAFAAIAVFAPNQPRAAHRRVGLRRPGPACCATPKVLTSYAHDRPAHDGLLEPLDLHRALLHRGRRRRRGPPAPGPPRLRHRRRARHRRRRPLRRPLPGRPA